MSLLPLPKRVKTIIFLCLWGVIAANILFQQLKTIDLKKFEQRLQDIPLLNKFDAQRIKNQILDIRDWFAKFSPKTFKMRSIFWNALVIVVILIWLCSGFFAVHLNEEAVVMRFGKIHRICKPGLRWHLPEPIETHKIADVTSLHKITVTTDLEDSDTLVLTNDENMLAVQFTIFWRVNNVADYLFRAKSPNEIVGSAAETVMRQIMSNTRSQDALTAGRQEIANKVKVNLQKLLDEYMIGIEVVDAQIGKIDPPESVIDAYREVLKAKLEGETKKNEAESYASYVVPKAEGEAYDIYSKAKSREVALIANAEGERDSYLAVLKAYQANPELVKEIIRANMMDEVMQKCAKVHVVDESIPLLVTDKLLGVG